ncbi:MAG TPA: hypothetical protein PK760_06165 [Flavobacteriales bacterium]|nr:hypothetical protein [Flavobacteriales bacterium]
MTAIALPMLLQAQIPSTEVVEVNDLFQGAVIVKEDLKGRFVFDIYENGKRTRQDLVNMEFLDEGNIHFSVEENEVVLSCKSEHPQCFQKEIFKLSMKRLSSRSNLACPPNDIEGARSIEALRNMIRSARSRLAEAHETRAADERRK